MNRITELLDPQPDFATALYHARVKLSYDGDMVSQPMMAQLLGVCLRTYTKWELGHSVPNRISQAGALAIAGAFWDKYQVADFLASEGHKTSNQDEKHDDERE